MAKKNIGIIFADRMEYLPFLEYTQGKYECEDIIYRCGRGFTADIKKAVLHAVECGIGKVNAASAAAFLIADNKVDMILSAGLSGAIADFPRGSYIAGTTYIEADFDLTPIGYAPGEKPQEKFVYEADPALIAAAANIKGVKAGALGTGDFFLADAEKRDFYRDTFGIKAFDMETAAIASVCYKTGTPFLALRKISDGAGEGASDDYTEMNDIGEQALAELLYKLIDIIV